MNRHISGIITKNGKWIPCDFWQHISTATRNQTDDQFIKCDEHGAELVGDLNTKMLDALYDYCTNTKRQLENVIGNDLENAIAKMNR